MDLISREEALNKNLKRYFTGIPCKKAYISNILGCSWMNLKNYLEDQFEEGMTWDNRGEWHIDHIIPLCTANNETDMYKLAHYTNLQPLWAKDNMCKGGKL